MPNVLYTEYAAYADGRYALYSQVGNDPEIEAIVRVPDELNRREEIQALVDQCLEQMNDIGAS